MIRREIQSDDGSPAWALISQIEHARIAGELATDWDVAAYPFPDVVRPTIVHHDDGWAEWEQAPQIDPANGVPLAFTEIPNAVAHAIWRHSIERVSPWGPLAQFMVAQHFMRLRLSGDETDDPGVQTFLSEYGERCREWREEFTTNAELGQETNVPEVAVEFLRSFDLFSLYLCCTARAGPYELDFPNCGKLSMDVWDTELIVDPWPWSVPEKTVHTAAAVIPAAPLQSDQQLRERMKLCQIDLHWRLLPRSQCRGQ